MQVGKSDAEANVPVEPSPVTEAEFDDMVRSCVRNDAMEKVKTKRAVLAKRLQVSLCVCVCVSFSRRYRWLSFRLTVVNIDTRHQFM